ncbi:phosphonate C-P lyase system protein PhnH [Paenibacillus azoreducens]|uniref:Carbon-phosphorus lyase subunit PhnH n=1 Tax=Paenibacillus azoreducens TaxID=116718 RepID=A0A919YIU6_9BACL|nr:phosphonate C-P lyase system protein PhnH [Paenibacillus azoreducens]GIO51284.1 carbon-phosphorus lyase subunit PhnH [Paenibacillus azoreducens]
MSFHAIHDIQRAYRKVVDSMARPGRVSDLSEEASRADAGFGSYPSTWVLAVMMLDTEVTFKIYSRRENELSRLFNQLTFASRAETEKADYIFVLHDAEEGAAEAALRKAKTGSLADPHDSASIIIESGDLSDGSEWRLTGPGIREESLVRLPLEGGLLLARAERNAEYPMGLDMIVVDRKHRLICLPRTTQISRREVQLAWDM